MSKNIFELPSASYKEEFLESLMESKAVRIERIVSSGHTTDWYDQEEEEYVILLQGTAHLEYENKEIVKLQSGDTLHLPAHKRHRVVYTSKEPPCIWICVFWKE